MIRGKEEKSEGPLHTMMYGKDISLAYLSGLVYSGEPSQDELGKSFIWKVKSRSQFVGANPDLILVESDRFYAAHLERQGFTLIPKWILFTLDLSKPLPEIMKSIKNNSLDNNLRRMKKHHFSYEITRDTDKFNLFYHQMYLPFATVRFGKASWIFSYRDLKKLLKNGQVLFIKQHNEYLAGALLLERGKSLFSHSLGVRDGNTEYIGQGVVTASYLFTIQWAKEKGFEWIDFGLCRPFLRDGVFVYKKRWGMAIKNVDRSLSQGVFGLKICRFTESVRSFLAENPFVFIDGNKLRGLIFSEQREPLNPSDVKLLMRIHFINGLDGIIAVSPSGFTREALETAKIQYPRLLHLVSMDVEVFFEHISNPEYLGSNLFKGNTDERDCQ